MMTGANRRLCSACLLVVAAVVTAFLASGCLWGVVRDAQTGVPVAGASVSFSCPCEPTQYTWGPPVVCRPQATTDANGIYSMDMLPMAPYCRPSATWYTSMRIRKVGYEEGYYTYYTPAFDYRDNPNASFDDLHSFWEVQNFELVPGKWAQVMLVSFDISRARVTDEAGYFVEMDAGYCNEEWGGDIISTDPPSIDLKYPEGCTIQADQVEVRVTLKVDEVDTPESESDVSTAGFNWTVPEGETGWLTATLDSADAAGPDDPDLEFTAQLRYRSLTKDTVLP